MLLRRKNPQANPFQPGAGTWPPHFAGRAEDLAVFRRGWNSIKAGGPRPGPIVAFGPRGNGKTVLLLEFENIALERRPLKPGHAIEPNHADGDAIIHGQGKDGAQAVKIPAAALRNHEELAFRLAFLVHKEGIQTGKETHWKSGFQGMGVGIGASGSRSSAMPKPQLDAALLALGERPTLLVCDEAHTWPLEGGREMLNAEQSARGSGAKIQLALAGTPDLRDHLSQMNASFWSRLGNRKRALGLLGREDAIEAIQKPMTDTISADINDSKIQDDLLNLTSGYPYFIQIMGEVLWDIAQQAKAKVIDAEILKQALPSFIELKESYYEDRVLDLRTKGILGAAYAVSRLADLEGGWEKLVLQQIETAAQIGARLGIEAAGAPTQPDFMLALRHEGFLWTEKPGGMVECGIPTLSAYVADSVGQQFPLAAKALKNDPEFSELLSGA